MSFTTVMLAVAHRHAGRLLAAVLQGVDAVEGELGHPLPGGVHAEDAAGFFHSALITTALMAPTSGTGAALPTSVEPTGPGAVHDKPGPRPAWAGTGNVAV